MDESSKLGTEKIEKLVIWKAVPISIGVFAVSLYFLADTIFVGHFVGTLGISAVTVVLPIVLLVCSIGTAIGLGGSTLISLELGQRSMGKANTIFGNMVALTLLITITIVSIGIFFENEMLTLFGARGDTLPVALDYFKIVLPGVPFMAFDIMVNYVMNAEGRPKAAMITMMIPAIINILLDALLIIVFDWGIEGAAWATTIAYMCSAVYSIWFFFFRNSEIKLDLTRLGLKYPVVKEIMTQGLVPFIKNGSGSVLIVVFNHTLFAHGAEIAVAMYGILNRFQIFIVFPLTGIVQSFSTVVGFNFGAQKWQRVKTAINVSIKTGTIVTLVLFTLVMLFPRYLVHIFTTTPELIDQTPAAMRLFFLFMPFFAIQQIGTTYFRAIGDPNTALKLNLALDLMIIILVPILPTILDLNGVWIGFALGNIISTGIIYFKLRQEIHRKLNPKITAG